MTAKFSSGFGIPWEECPQNPSCYPQTAATPKKMIVFGTEIWPHKQVNVNVFFFIVGYKQLKTYIKGVKVAIPRIYNLQGIAN